MKALRFALVIIFLLVASSVTPRPVSAVKGTPTSADFGYGVRLDLRGELITEAFQSAAKLEVDWVGVDFDWAANWREANLQPDLQQLDLAMQQARQSNLSVLLSLSQPPTWALTPVGPDPDQVARFVVTLAQRYPETLQAVELFPGANTGQGWGALPDAQAYVTVIAVTQAALSAEGVSLLLVCGGLTPLPAGSDGAEIDDLVFLRRLYAAGAAQIMPVLSIRLPHLTGDPLRAPDGREHRILRHYEEVRQVMLENGHASGVLWITTFSLPSGKIQASDSLYQGLREQTLWLTQAFRQLRAQLYIGVVCYDRLNPPGPGAQTQEIPSINLLRSDLSLHPFYEILGQLIAQNNQNTITSIRSTEPQIKRINKDRGWSRYP